MAVLLAVLVWLLPPSRLPAVGTSAPGPVPTSPSGQPGSRTFGGYEVDGLPRLIRWPRVASARRPPWSQAMQEKSTSHLAEAQ